MSTDVQPTRKYATSSDAYLKIINEANDAVDAYRFAKAKKTIELLAPDNPPPGFKKPTEIMLGALLDTDQNLIVLRRARDAKLAILAVAKAELGGLE